MSGTSDTVGADLEALTRAYLEALGAGDLERCLDFFASDAVLNWQSGVYRGHAAVEDWHKDRLGAEFRILDLESIGVHGEEVMIDALVTSKRLEAWRLKSLSGRATITFKEGKIIEVSFQLRITNPFEHWA